MPSKSPRIKRRKTADQRREIVIKVLVTSDEQERLQAAADRQGLAVSTWMRVIALQQAVDR